MALRKVGLLHKPLGGTEILEHLHDLPDVEPRPDHPRPSLEVLAAKADAGKAPCAHRFLGQRLHDRALGAMGAFGLLLNSHIGRPAETNTEWLAFQLWQLAQGASTSSGTT